MILDNSDGNFSSLEAVSDSIKLACGIRKITQVWENGDWRIELAPGSIAIRNMEETPFREFCLRAQNYAAAVLSVSSDQLADALQEYLEPPNYRD